jgi:hypothetical protein
LRVNSDFFSSSSSHSTSESSKSSSLESETSFKASLGSLSKTSLEYLSSSERVEGGCYSRIYAAGGFEEGFRMWLPNF